MYFFSWMIVIEKDTPGNCFKKEVDLMLESLFLVTELLVLYLTYFVLLLTVQH